jgi:sulfatase modifying factor 1
MTAVKGKPRMWSGALRFMAAAVSIALIPLMMPSRVIAYEMVAVGDPGNAADTTGLGAVAYEYWIGKYEVTIGQYTAFLNAVAAIDLNGLYDTRMTTDQRVAGIVRSGSDNNYSYSVSGPFGSVQVPEATASNRPISYVSWFSAARFANWLSNGQPTGPQGPATTENGTYDLSNWLSGTAPVVNATNPNTGLPPLYRVPTENEWYKAAFYKAGDISAGYWTYATQSDAAPSNVIGTGSNSANYAPGSPRRYSVTQSINASSSQNYLTDVGAFAGSPSAYGTFDQSGNVYELYDQGGQTDFSRYRGGGWDWTEVALSSFESHGVIPFNAYSNVGFRLASTVAPVPEPSTYATALAGLACGGYLVRRRRKRASPRRLLLLAAVVTAAVATAATPAFAELVNYEMVTVGDPGNAADTTGYGAVAYEYQIGKYEVTIGQYVAFLNAVAKDDPYGLFSPSMTAGLRVPWVGGGEATCVAGISRSGLPTSFAYTALGPTGYAPQGANSTLDRPVSFVSWFDAARFANWMSNGQPIGGPSPSTTEDGAYPLNGQVSGVVPVVNAINPNTNLSPAYCIPTTDQWYKAAYYDPALNGAIGGYHLYPTRSDDVPLNALGDAANSMNGILDFRRTVTQAEGVDSSQNYLTNVGAFTSSPSAYGTFDQGGNVQEWTDLDGLPGEWRQYRGADWSMHVDYSRSQYRRDVLASYESTYIAYDNAIGFRLATPVPVAVPEPSTYCMALAGLACGGYTMFRRRKRA